MNGERAWEKLYPILEEVFSLDFSNKFIWDLYSLFLSNNPNTPNPFSGLVPCRCGGKSAIHYGVRDGGTRCFAKCENCPEEYGIGLDADAAVEAFNAAMGYEGKTLPSGYVVEEPFEEGV